MKYSSLAHDSFGDGGSEGDSLEPHWQRPRLDGTFAHVTAPNHTLTPWSGSGQVKAWGLSTL